MLDGVYNLSLFGVAHGFTRLLQRIAEVAQIAVRKFE
jgi:hypothetical protein